MPENAKNDRILRLDGVTKRFGGLIADNNVTTHVNAREIVGLIGPNGAGKTTLFNCISGIYAPEEGYIGFMETDITRKPANEVCRLRIARTFQIERVFREQTGLENVMIGAFCRTFSFTKARKRALEVMEFCGFLKLAGKLAGSMNVCDRRRLEFARALATEPELLLLDEVAAGLNPTELQDIVALVRRVRTDLGISVLWVEHVMEAIMNVSDRLIVLDHGVKIAEGTPAEIASNALVIEAYLGVGHNA